MFSFIIPHKNTPELLIRCVNSILQRDDIEIIIVDDNSSPDIVDFNKFPCVTNPKVKVIFNKEAKGAGHARNIALPLAIGKWIIFADSDDFFNPCFEDLLNDYINSTDDIIYFNANSVDSNTLKPSNRVDHLHQFFEIYRKDNREGEQYFKYMFTEPWCKIIKNSLIAHNNISFEETLVCNDVRFSYSIGHRSNKIIVDYREGYCVTASTSSLSQKSSKEAMLIRFTVVAEWANFLRENNINIEIPYCTYMFYKFSRKLYKDNKAFRKEYHALRSVGYKRMYIWHIIEKNILFITKQKIRRLLKY